jgi:phage shock protein PspC (stress-responsive transcriptional regulator)
MKQVININFQGRVVPIEVTAFDTLKTYTESLHRYFANEEGRDEIINDIESRIAELFQERIKAGATCITDSDVEAIIKSIGRPEDFEEADGGSSAASEQKQANNKSSQAEQPKTAPGTHKRLYRDENHKVLGGVCSGIANYFGMDPVIIRIIFVVLLFAGGVGILPYIIFWIAVPSSATTVIGGSRKKFFRDPDDKIVAGVCSGISNYFGINVWIPRALFLLPFISIVFRWSHWGFYDFPSFLNFSISPGSLIIYIILWLVVPEAATTAEKLEMKGEKVDMNSIKNSVMEEMKGVGQRVEKFTEEATDFATDKGKVMGAEMGRVAKRTGTSLGDVILFGLKILAYIIIGSVVLMLVFALFGLGIAAIGVFPLKDYLLTSGWQNAFAWGTLLFFIAVPVIGIITWLIRRIAKVKGKSKMVRWTFASLWVLGWISVICLVASISRDFKSFSRPNSQPVYLNNPGVNKLELTTNMPNEHHYNNRWMRFEPFQGITDGDTVYVQNVQVVIEKSLTDSFSVAMEKFANGNTRDYADTAARAIQYYAVQRDTVLLLDKGIPITQQNKFRNQHLILRVFVPVGKKIKINRNIGWGNEATFRGPFGNRDNWHIGWDDEDRDYSQNWDFNVEYTMTADGLQTKDGKYLKDKNKWTKTEYYRNRTTTNTVSDDDNYRYDNTPQAMDKIDSAKQKIMKEEQKLKDSLEKVKQKIDQQLEKIDNRGGNNEEEPEALISNYVPLKDVSVKIM